jgi:hypothetical protein
LIDVHQIAYIRESYLNFVSFFRTGHVIILMTKR